MKRSVLSLIAALALGLALAGAAVSAPPPTLEVSVIGHGVVNGSSINCGGSHLACATAFGTDSASITLTEAPKDGWTFDHWEDASGTTVCGTSPPATTCALSGLTGDNTIFAVFTSNGTVTPTTLDATLSDDAAGEVLSNSATYPIDCGTDSLGGAQTACGLDVVAGSTITLRERPNDGFFFKNWGGACSSTKATCSVYMSATEDVSADFVAAGTNLLTVNVDGGGTVTGNGISCSSGATCTSDEPSNSKITLTASPANGYAFSGWDDDCQGAQSTCSVDMSAARIVTATFVKVVPVLLTVNGAGTVSGDDISCGPGPSTCSGAAAPGTTIQFQATPTVAGSTVTWLGCTSASGNLCNVVVGSNPISVTATFSGGTTGGGGGGSFVALTIDVEGDGYVTALSGATLYCTAAGGSGCTANVQQNTSVTLRAQPASGSLNDFDSWEGCVSTSTSCTVVMSTARAVTANFQPNDNTTYDLTASVVGGGTVTGAGLNSCRITNSVNCTSPQAANAAVTITAQPNPGQVFSGWSGDCTGTSPTCNVRMDSDQNVTATFRAGTQVSNKLTIQIGSAGTVSGLASPCVGKAGKTTTCSATTKSGATVTLKESPAKGYVFVGWMGACSGAKATCDVQVAGETDVLATFKPAPIAAGAKKPTVLKLKSGYRVTITFRAGEAGRLTVTTKPKSATIRKTVKAGAGVVRVTVKKRGRYVVTLSLKAKSGTHALRYTVKV